MKLRKYIKPFIDEHPHWAETSRIKAENVLDKICYLADRKPADIWRELIGRYSERTAIYAASLLRTFIDYLIEIEVMQPPNEFRAWSRKHLARKTSSFTKRLPTISFEECVKKILTIQNSQYRLKALQLLYGGMRFKESLTYNPTTEVVVGKGGKEREIILPDELKNIPFKQSQYRHFARTLAALGLKPHDLRKIRATQLASMVDTFTLQNIFGWSTLQTADAYVTGAKVRDIKKTLLLEVPKEALGLGVRKCS